MLSGGTNDVAARSNALVACSPTAKPVTTSKPTLAPTIDWSTETDDAYSFSYSYFYGGDDDDWTGTKCACSAFYNGADPDDEFLCIKSNGVCRPPNRGDGLCPGDHDMCSNKPDEGDKPPKDKKPRRGKGKKPRTG